MPWNLKYVSGQPYLHPGTWNTFLVSHTFTLELEICFWSAILMIFTPWNLKYVSDQPVGIEYRQAIGVEESNVLQQLNCNVFQIMSKQHIASTRDSRNRWSPTCKTMDDKEKRCKCFSQSICFPPPQFLLWWLFYQYHNFPFSILTYPSASLVIRDYSCLKFLVFIASMQKDCHIPVIMQ